MMTYSILVERSDIINLIKDYHLTTDTENSSIYSLLNDVHK